jgi:nitrate/TMAO reductase-like tetraheme cytochrome c subunit
MKKLIALAAAAAFALAVQALPAAAAEHAAVGSAKCKMCHKVEYDSWAKTKHAAAKPPVECETCHGNGGDYWKMSVMKDPAAAKAAGLIAKPDKASCTAKCHKPAEFKDEMLGQVHEKKAKK